MLTEPADVRVRIYHESDIVHARGAARHLAEEMGFDEVDETLIATAISELGRNIVLYAGRGEILVRSVTAGGVRGIRIVAEDHGPGIADTALAMQDGYSTGGGLGLGLPGTRRLMDDFDLRSRPGQGTTVTATKWARR